VLELSPAQAKFVVKATKRYNAAPGAVRSGKTIAASVCFAEKCTQQLAGEVVAIARNPVSAYLNIFAPLMRADLFGSFAGTVSYTPGARFGKVCGKRVWVFGSSDIRSADRLKGLTASAIIVDELTTIDKMMFEQAMLRMSLPESQLWATTNPAGPSHWAKLTLIDRAAELDAYVQDFQLTDNPVLPDDIIAAYHREHSGSDYERNILGRWANAEGCVYRMFSRERHVVDIVPAVKRWIAVGIDWGLSDATHALLIGAGSDGRLYVVAEWVYDGLVSSRDLDSRAIAAELVDDWLMGIPVPGAGFRGISARYNTELMFVTGHDAKGLRNSLRTNMGIMAHAADSSHGSARTGIDTVSKLFNTDQLMVHSSCRQLISDLEQYAWDPHGQDVPAHAHSHGPDALRYGITRTRQHWDRLLAVPLLSAPMPPDSQPYEATFSEYAMPLGSWRR
jgi:PBSX family phage terminase large subunit